jgi:anti-sigma B factor antagonist
MNNARPVVVKQLPEKFSVEQARNLLLDIDSSLKADRPRLVLDCSQVRRLDSAGVQAILYCLEEAMKRNGDVKLAAVPRAAAEILELTKVDSLFELFDTPAEAVNSFYQFPVHVFPAPPLQPTYPTPASERVA